MEDKETKKDYEKPKCKRCGSYMTYIRLKDNQRVCRNCGYVEELKNPIKIMKGGKTK